MVTIRGMKRGGRLYRHCNAGCQDDKFVGGVAVVVEDQSDEWLLDHGWTTNERGCWFCPACAEHPAEAHDDDREPVVVDWCVGHSGTGFYFWSQEYSEEGSSGPYTTLDEAYAAMSIEQRPALTQAAIRQRRKELGV